MSASTEPLSRAPQRPRALSEQDGNRTSSLSNRLKNLLPRHRPERGGTKRDHGFWEEIDSSKGDDNELPRCRLGDSRQSRRSETADSDRITRWNTARDIPPKPPGQTQAHRRAASMGIEALMALSPNRNRKWSWAPQEEQLLVNPLHRAAVMDALGEDPVNESLARQTSQLEAAIVASRRLSQVRRTIEAEREKRRMRRSLKESGDYLGVQGINPETGQLDIVTPSDSEHSTVGLETEQRIDALKKMIKNAPSTRSPTITRAEREMQRILNNVRDRTLKAEQEKEALMKANKVVRWRRKTKQWSSAQEPNLSPIAQSLANVSPSTSRRSSNKKEHAQEGLLIDLGGPRLSPQSTMFPQRPPAEITDSSGTVVRTPHPHTHQRAIRLSPSAQELFENDISFSHSLQASSNNDSDGLQPVNGKSLPALVPPSESRRTNSLHQLAPDGSFNAGPKSSVVHPKSPQQNQVPLTDSFLDIRHLRRGDPGGIQPRTSKMTRRSPLAPHGIEKVHPEKKPPEMRQTKARFPNLEPDLTMVPKESSPSPMMSQESRPQPPSAENQLEEECDLTFLLGPQEGQSPLEEAQADHLHAQKELPPMEKERVVRDRSHLPARRFRARSHDRSSREFQLVRSRIRDNMRDMNNKLEQIDIPSPASPTTAHIKANQNKAVLQADIWDTTKQHDKIKEESVSTPTTTITGSDPKMFTSSQLREPATTVHNLRRTTARRLAYNALTKLNSMEALGSLQNSQMQATSKSLLNPEHQSKTLAPDTTSTDRVESTEQRTQHVASSPHQMEKEDFPLWPHQPSSISRIFTSMARRGKEAYKEKVDVGTKAHGNGEARPNNAQVRPSASKKAPMGFNGRPRMEQGLSPQPDKLRQGCVESDQGSLDLTRQIPGSYPILRDAEEDIVVLFNAFRRKASKGSQKPGLLAAMKESSQTVKANVLWLLRLYWAAVRPVFNADSEYWGRNVRHASTWKDCASLVLAAPAGLLLMMSFV